jgi:hypothetical protein
MKEEEHRRSDRQDPNNEFVPVGCSSSDKFVSIESHRGSDKDTNNALPTDTIGKKERRDDGGGKDIRNKITRRSKLHG